MADLSAKFGANVNRLNSTKNVWSTDATFKDTSGNATFTQAEAKKFQNVLNMANGSLKKAAPYLRVINQNRNDLSVSTQLKIFLNTYIRGGEQIRDTKNVLARFDKYYDAVLQKKVDSVRTETAKKRWNVVKKNGLKELRANKTSLYYVIATYITFQTAKTMVIRKLQQAEGIGTFLRTSNGYRVTAPEGFVAIDHVGKALKLVDIVAESVSKDINEGKEDINKLKAKFTDKSLKVRFKVFNDEGKEVQKYYGEMIDGSALPEWIKVDPKTGRTKTNIPKGEKLVEFKIIAVDTDNNKKQVTVVIDPEKIAKDKEILKEVRKTAKAKIMINKDGSIKLKSINKDGSVNKTTTDVIN